jgi:hypothetical protein
MRCLARSISIDPCKREYKVFQDDMAADNIEIHTKPDPRCNYC